MRSFLSFLIGVPVGILAVSFILNATSDILKNWSCSNIFGNWFGIDYSVICSVLGNPILLITTSVVIMIAIYLIRTLLHMNQEF